MGRVVLVTKIHSCDRLMGEELAHVAMAICATAEALGHDLSQSAAELMADDLASYPALVIRDALRACRRELTSRLTLAAILQRINAADGRPEPSEAWAIALSASDEAATVVMTQEITQALFAAKPVLDSGDSIGARMAFIAAYQRLLSSARAEAKPVVWSVSLGRDPSGRVFAIEEACRNGRLSAPVAQGYLADLRQPEVTDDGRAIAGLLTGKTPSSSCSQNARERLAEIKRILKQSAADRAHRRAKEELLRREAYEEQTRQIDALIESKLAESKGEAA